MYLGGRLVTNAHMRSLVVVETDKLINAYIRLFKRPIQRLTIQLLCLNNAVYALSYSVVCRLESSVILILAPILCSSST